MTGTVIRFRAHRARTRAVTWAVPALLAAVREWRIRRRATADLRAMDDGLLADIGLDAGNLPAVVEGLMARARSPVSGRGAEEPSGEERTALAA